MVNQRRLFDPGVPGAGDEGFDDEKNGPRVRLRLGEGTLSELDAALIKFDTARFVGLCVAEKGKGSKT